jgi:hypothetical protein
MNWPTTAERTAAIHPGFRRRTAEAERDLCDREEQRQDQRKLAELGDYSDMRAGVGA